MTNFIRQAHKAQPSTSGPDISFLSKKKKHVVPYSKPSKKAQKLSFRSVLQKRDGGLRSNGEVPQHIVDADIMTATELKEKYELTYNTWRNMKGRAKSQDAVIDPKFDKFRDFLRHMGPRPTKDFTLDRLDNDDPRYGPGLCAWRDKNAQNNNKSTTVTLTDVDGTTLPIGHWAKITGQKADTMRKRRNRGWSDAEVIAGRRFENADAGASSHRLGASALDIWPADTFEKRDWWEQRYQTERMRGETRNQFLLRTVRAMLDEIGEREPCNDLSELPDDLREKVERAFRIVEVCEERERQARASRNARASEHRRVDPYA